jgi:hypothetical protein
MYAVCVDVYNVYLFDREIILDKVRILVAQVLSVYIVCVYICVCVHRIYI